MSGISKKFKTIHKLLLISVITTVPIIVLLYFLLENYNSQIDFSMKEKYGVEVIQPLTELSYLLPEQQNNLYLHYQGEINVSEQIQSNRDKIKTQFAELITVYEKYQNELNSKETAQIHNSDELFNPKAVYKKWSELENRNSAATIDETLAGYNSLQESLSEMIRHIGDVSNLILDPDLDSYYLMDITVLVMPEIMKKFSDILLITEKLDKEKNISKSDYGELLYLGEFIAKDDIKRMDRALKISFSSDEKYYGASIDSKLNDLFSNHKDAITNFNLMLNRVSPDSNENVSYLKFQEYWRSALLQGYTLWKASGAELLTALDQRIEYIRSNKNRSLLISLGVFLFALLMVRWISTSITRRITRITQIASMVAEGELAEASQLIAKLKFSFKISKDRSEKINDEMYILFLAVWKMTENLESLVSKMRNAGTSVEDAAKQIASSAHDLEATVAEQAASSSEVNATSKEIYDTSSELAQSMNNITKMSDETAAIASHGLESLSSLKDSMSDIITSTDEITEKLNIISQKKDNISIVVTTITKVTNLINLLSLNAAIEAEKAGKYGAGFSVVAKEIRHLADQTAVAALDIEQIITEMQDAVNDGVNAVKNFSEDTLNSSFKTNSILNKLSRVIEKTRELAPTLGKVNSGMQMQTEGAGQIFEAMKQLSEAAVQTRDSLVEFNKTAKKLTYTVGALNDEMSKFKLTKTT